MGKGTDSEIFHDRWQMHQLHNGLQVVKAREETRRQCYDNVETMHTKRKENHWIAELGNSKGKLLCIPKKKDI